MAMERLDRPAVRPQIFEYYMNVAKLAFNAGFTDLSTLKDVYNISTKSHS